MEDVTGIKLDRSQPTSGEAIAVMGDEHLTRLEEVKKLTPAFVVQLSYTCLSILQTCKKLLAKMSVEKAELRKQSGTEILTALASPSSAKFTQVSLAFTEVLQMQVTVFFEYVAHVSRRPRLSFTTLIFHINWCDFLHRIDLRKL